MTANRPSILGNPNLSIVAIIALWWIGMFFTGCNHPPGHVPTAQEAAAAVRTPLTATTRAAAGATADVTSADRHLADLQTQAANRPAVPSTDVTAAVAPARSDLAAALAKLSEVFTSASDAARRALDLGGQVVSLTKERDALQAWKDDVSTWWLGPKFWRSLWWCLGIAIVAGVLSAASGLPWLGFISTIEGLIGKGLRLVLTAGIPHLLALIGSVWAAVRKTPPTPAADEDAVATDVKA